jgi:Spy/CpxP family protein refolding chaperone
MKFHLLRWLMPMLFGLALLGQPIHAQDTDDIIEKLRLTQTQREQVKKLREAFRKETEPIRVEINRLLEEEKGLKKAAKVNTEQLKTVLKQRADKEVELSLALTTFVQNLEGVFTPEQLKQWRALKEGK